MPRALLLRAADRVADHVLVARPAYVIGYLSAGVVASVALRLLGRRWSS